MSSSKGALVSQQENTGTPVNRILGNADYCQDYQIKPEAKVAAPDTSTWPLLLKVRLIIFFPCRFSDSVELR